MAAEAPDAGAGGSDLEAGAAGKEGGLVPGSQGLKTKQPKLKKSPSGVSDGNSSTGHQSEGGCSNTSDANKSSGQRSSASKGSTGSRASNEKHLDKSIKRLRRRIPQAMRVGKPEKDLRHNHVAKTSQTSNGTSAAAQV